MGRSKIPSNEVLETMGYRDLQLLAKDHGISGKQAAVAIMNDLMEERDKKKAGGQKKATPKSKVVSLTALYDDQIRSPTSRDCHYSCLSSSGVSYIQACKINEEVSALSMLGKLISLV